MKTVYTQAITINGRRYTLDELHKAAGCALRHRERRTGARLNLSYTTVGDLVSSAWLLMSERGLSLTRAADEAARQALRQQQRHAHAEIPDTVPAQQTEETDGDELPPILARLAAGYTLANIAKAQGRSVSTVWRAAQRERAELCKVYI